jgi:hypothetical protein
MTPELNSIPKTQERLGGVSRQHVYNLIAAGRLQRVNLGRRAFITTASIDALLRDLVGV